MVNLLALIVDKQGAYEDCSLVETTVPRQALLPAHFRAPQPWVPEREPLLHRELDEIVETPELGGGVQELREFALQCIHHPIRRLLHPVIAFIEDFNQVYSERRVDEEVAQWSWLAIYGAVVLAMACAGQL